MRLRESQDGWDSLSDLIIRRLLARTVIVVGDEGDSVVETLCAQGVDARGLSAADATEAELTLLVGAPIAELDELLARSKRVLMLCDGLSHDAKIAALCELAARGLFRVSFEPQAHGAILLERIASTEAVRRYEHWSDQLSRHADVLQFLGVEYREELAARELELAGVAAEELAAAPRSPVHAVLQDVLQLRSRFAPADSLRMRAVDWSLTHLHRATTETLRLFDRRDAFLQQGRNWTMKLQKLVDKTKS